MAASNLPLKITEMSDIFIPPQGGKKLFILCDDIPAEDIAVRFSCEGPNYPWEVTVYPTYVHKKCALILTSPAYDGGELENTREVFVRIFRPSNGKSSSSELMYFVPK